MSRYKDFAELSSDFSWETNEKGLFIFISGKNLLGYKKNDLLGKKAADFMCFNPESPKNIPFSTEEILYDLEFFFRRADGSVATLITSAIPLRDRNSAWQGARGICHDVTSDRQRDAELAAAQNRERILSYVTRAIREPTNAIDSLNSVLGAITITLAVEGCEITQIEDRRGPQKIAAIGPLPFSISERLSEGIDNRLIFDQSGHRFAAQTTRYHGKINGIITFWGKGESSDWNDDDLFLFEQVADLVGIELEHLTSQKDLERLSTKDSLTGLLNRRTFEIMLEEKVFNSEKKHTRPGTLAFIDLDNFKLINDAMGHQSGDRALTTMGKMLQSLASTNDLIARYGGDEFAIWFHQLNKAEATEKLSSLLRNKKFIDKYSIDNQRPFGISVGIVGFEKTIDTTPSFLIGRADSAMYEAKRKKKSTQKLIH